MTALNENTIDRKTIVQFTTVPIGEGVSVSRFVTEALKEIQKSGLRYQLTPMATNLEANTAEEAVDVILNAHEAVFKAGAKRVITLINIDDRRDKPRRMEDKVEKIENKIE